MNSDLKNKDLLKKESVLSAKLTKTTNAAFKPNDQVLSQQNPTNSQ